MKYKLAEDGKSVLIGENGHPIVIQDDETEIELRATELFQTKIPALNAESKQHRQDKEKFEKLFNDLTAGLDGVDLEAAKAAIETVKGYESKDLITAEKANKAKAELEKILKDQNVLLKEEYATKSEGFNNTINGLNGTIRKLMVSGKFPGSKALKGTIFEHSPEAAEALFGNNFKIEGDDVIGYLDDIKIMDPDPNQIDKAANFHDSLSHMINRHDNAKNYKMAGSGANDGDTAPFAKSPKGAITVTREQMKDLNFYNKVTEQATKEGVEIQRVD